MTGLVAEVLIRDESVGMDQDKNGARRTFLSGLLTQVYRSQRSHCPTSVSV